MEDFIVDRNEGSQSVAMWTSKIRIEDPANNNVEQRKVWMNHPTWYKGWKIAQASWNPGDLHQSTLQVKREPAWVTALTWIGSGLVILGIGVMFYAPAIGKKLRQKPATEKPKAIPTRISSILPGGVAGTGGTCDRGFPVSKLGRSNQKARPHRRSLLRFFRQSS